ncbi:hypothetical protein [Cellulosimicrobium funkei]|uniref:hypothetical protein n=1 Tax=Cellulosimicrobium funkei TaxID=264251 RepID=UPI0036928724
MMGMIGPQDLPGLDESVARRLLSVARTIAPCLDSLTGDDYDNAIAILEGVAAELPAPGTGRMRSQSRNGTAVTWGDYTSAFGPDDRAALRSLCGTSAAAVGAPVGSFPPSTIACGIWPTEGH